MSVERNIPRAGEIYRHFKDKLYQIVTIAKHSETGEMMVVYQALYGEYKCCARPLDMFMSEVDRDKYPDVKQKYRFEKVEINVDVQPSTEKNDNDPETNDDIADANDNNVDANDSNNTESDDNLYNLMQFLDADTFEEKKRILLSIRNKMNDELINAMAASLDVIVDDGDIDKRFSSLLSCVSMMEKFEVNNRLR